MNMGDVRAASADLHSPSLKSAGFPVRRVFLALLTMALLTGLSALATLRLENSVRVLTQSQLTVQTQSERLARLSEVSGLTIAMAVRTGDPSDSAVHLQLQTQMRDTLRQLKRAIALPVNARAAVLLERSEERRFAMERRALNLAAAQQDQSARRVIASAEFKRLVREHSAGAESIQRRSAAYVSQVRSDLDRSLWIARVASLVGIPLIAVAWLMIIGPARRWGRDLDEARAAAEAAGTAKSDFLAMMSHEIRTPLNSIIGFTDLVLAKGGLDKEQHRRISLVQDASASLLTIVNDVLDYSAVSSGRLSLESKPFVPAVLVDNAVSILGAQAAEKGLEIRATIEDSLRRPFLGDEHRIRQVMLNLLNNAVKFTDKGRIAITVREAGSDAAGTLIHFAVQDSGIGISDEAQSALFERFSQADSSITRRFGGSGLGLAICKQLVEQMGGAIGVVSGEGKGSLFWFTINVPPASGEAADVEDAATAETRPLDLLLVDDMALNRELACAMLGSLGHRVTVACDGIEAVEAARRTRFDLILMDIQMPRMDGLSAARAIRAFDGEAGQMPIVAMTANVLPRQIQEFREAGMVGHVAKPIKLRALAEEIAKAATKSEAADAARHAEGGQDAAADFDPETFEGLKRLLTPARALDHLARLDAKLEECSRADLDDAEFLGAVHKLVAQAGSLGFTRLSGICSELDAAGRGGCATPELVARFREAAAVARVRVREVKATA